MRVEYPPHPRGRASVPGLPPASVPAAPPRKKPGRGSWARLLLAGCHSRDPIHREHEQAAEAPTRAVRVSSGGEPSAGRLTESAARRLLGVRGRSPCVCKSENRATNQSEQRIDHRTILVCPCD